MARHAQRQIIPVIEEQPTVEKRVRTTGRVLVHKRPVTDTVVVDAVHVDDRVRVERVHIDRPVQGPLPVRQEGEVIIVPVVEEIAVVEHRFVLREEVRITRERVEKHQPIKTTLTRDEVTVERVRKRGSS